MRLRAQVGIVTAVGALAVTGPAAAEALTHGHHGRQGQGNAQQSQGQAQQGGQSRRDEGRCGRDHGRFGQFGRRGRSFGRSKVGTLVSWHATQTGTNTYSGTITVTQPAFKPHRDRKGSSAQTSTQSTQSTQQTQTTQVTYTFTNAKVFFGQGANPRAAGDVVKIIGARRNHCSSSATSTSPGTSTSTSSSGTSTPSGSGTATSTGNVRAIFIAAPRTASKS